MPSWSPAHHVRVPYLSCSRYPKGDDNLRDGESVSTKSALLPHQRMRVAYTLTLVGGYLDAYTYFERGGVFANAQTGNIVKLGIALAHRERETYLQFLLPIFFIARGLFTALTIQDALEDRGRRLKRRAVLATEMVGLAIVGFIPEEPQFHAIANCIVSFVAAMQFEAFRSKEHTSELQSRI